MKRREEKKDFDGGDSILQVLQRFWAQPYGQSASSTNDQCRVRAGHLALASGILYPHGKTNRIPGKLESWKAGTSSASPSMLTCLTSGIQQHVTPRGPLGIALSLAGPRVNNITPLDQPNGAWRKAYPEWRDNASVINGHIVHFCEACQRGKTCCCFSPICIHFPPELKIGGAAGSRFYATWGKSIPMRTNQVEARPAFTIRDATLGNTNNETARRDNSAGGAGGRAVARSRCTSVKSAWRAVIG